MSDQNQAFTAKHLEIRDKGNSIYDRLCLLSTLSELLACGIEGGEEHPTKHELGDVSRFIGTTARGCANDFDSLSIEEPEDLEAARRL